MAPNSMQPPSPQPLPADLPMGLSIAGEAVVYRHGDGRVQAWSARCTHLGCRLDRVIDGAAAARFNVYLRELLQDFRRVIL